VGGEEGKESLCKPQPGTPRRRAAKGKMMKGGINHTEISDIHHGQIDKRRKSDSTSGPCLATPDPQKMTEKTSRKHARMPYNQKWRGREKNRLEQKKKGASAEACNER